MVSTHIGFPTETVIVFIALSVGAIFIDLFMHRHDKPISLRVRPYGPFSGLSLRWHLPVSSISITVQKLPACLSRVMRLKRSCPLITSSS